jgi:Tn3 transposase DDE domain
MAESCGVPHDVLAWTAEWYFSAETLEAANAAIVNYHHRLPMTRAFGTGTLSSSDGQRFPVKGKSLTARHLSRYFAHGQGISTYTHASDQHSTFDTKVMAATAPESPYVLDGKPDRGNGLVGAPSARPAGSPSTSARVSRSPPDNSPCCSLPWPSRAGSMTPLWPRSSGCTRTRTAISCCSRTRAGRWHTELGETARNTGGPPPAGV